MDSRPDRERNKYRRELGATPWEGKRRGRAFGDAEQSNG